MVEQMPQEEPNPLMRKKKTPEELAREAEQEDLDDFTSKLIMLLYYMFFVFHRDLNGLYFMSHMSHVSFKIGCVTRCRDLFEDN